MEVVAETATSQSPKEVPLYHRAETDKIVEGESETPAMTGPQMVEREWTLDLEAGEAQLRCRYVRQGKQILEYTVQLELWCQENWRAIFRYDNAHGFCHSDLIHADGSQEKTRICRGDTKTNFTWAIQELRGSWGSQRSRFLAENEA